MAMLRIPNGKRVRNHRIESNGIRNEMAQGGLT